MLQPELNSTPYPFMLFDSLDEGVYIVDESRCCIYVNSKAAEIMSRSHEELLGKYIWELHPEAKETTLFAEMCRALAEKRTTHFEVYYPSFRKWFEHHCYPSKEGLIVLMQDITARKQTEAIVQRKAALLDLTTEAIIVWEFQGSILSWNKGGEQLYGFTQQ